MRVAVLAISLAMFAGSALAAEEVTAAPAPAKPQKEKVICKERVKANSRFTTRSCMTAAEWEKETETAKSAFSEVQNRPMFNSGRD